MKLVQGNIAPSAHFSTDKDYLDMRDLHAISNSYRDGNRGRIMQAIAKYQAFMAKKDTGAIQKIEKMLETQELLHKYIDDARDKGFGCHIMKKLQFAVYQQLQKLIPEPGLAKRVREAFRVMVKMDRLSEFNYVIQTAMIRNRLTSAAFSSFLNNCLQESTLPDNYKRRRSIYMDYMERSCLYANNDNISE